MIFNWIVRRVGFLKHVPLLAMLFDGWMMMWNAVVNPTILHAIDKIEKTVSAWNGIELSAHKFGGVQFNYRGKELGHIHSNGILDIPLPKKISSMLIANRQAMTHHIFTNSGWISFYIKGGQDYDDAVTLLRLSYEYKRKSIS